MRDGESGERPRYLIIMKYGCKIYTYTNIMKDSISAKKIRFYIQH